MVSVGCHPNIKLLTLSEVESVSGYVGNYQVRVKHNPRYVDETKCTGCGNCEKVCPIEVKDEFNQYLNERKAIYRCSPQAVPSAFVIDKKGVAPCRAACPTDQRAVGYISLIKQKKYADAYWVIKRENPFPSVCGRVCYRICEDACSRGKFDEPVNIMGIKRFISDWAFNHRDELAKVEDKSLVGTPFSHHPQATDRKIAIIGAGPAGLTSGLDLVRLGHSVKVFDAQPVAGGMIRVGIPPHRIPYEMLEWEIQQILDEGVELKLNTWVGDIPGLFKMGFDAVLLATGAHAAKKVKIPGNNHPDNWLSLPFLRQVCLGSPPDLTGRSVAVIGGGNVALDCARSVVRIGANECRMIFRKPKTEMTGFEWEVEIAEEEGVTMCGGTLFKEILSEHGRIIGVQCIRTDYHGYDAKGRILIDELSGTEHILPADLIIWATGQVCDLSFLQKEGGVKMTKTGIYANDEMMTSLQGVFIAGDVHRGSTSNVVDAIGEGHHAARCIDRYLRGKDGIPEPRSLPEVKIEKEEVNNRISNGEASTAHRISTSSTPIEERYRNFHEVEETMTEEEANNEAARCVKCGPCAECLECVTACDRGAIEHNMVVKEEDYTVGTIILATGFQEFDPANIPEFNYGKIDNVYTALDIERMINPSGPTGGKILLKNGLPPNDVAIIHCVGSRDVHYHQYCSRACCMYSLKLSQLIHDYVGAEVHEIYRDMRSFGKGYEEFYNRSLQMGIHFYHGHIDHIKQKNGKIHLSWKEAYYSQPNNLNVDMVILATAMEPQMDSGHVAAQFGITRDRDGFFKERHPKLAPVETINDGIFIAGACQAPKDIPDSIAQAGGAASAAMALMDQGIVALDPVVAEVDNQRCAGCGQCAEACPYKAIEVENRIARINLYLCRGCGTCAGACQSKAITLLHYEDRTLLAELIGALSVDYPGLPK